jgi:hypothetical protein
MPDLGRDCRQGNGQGSAAGKHDINIRDPASFE